MWMFHKNGCIFVLMIATFEMPTDQVQIMHSRKKKNKKRKTTESLDHHQGEKSALWEPNHPNPPQSEPLGPTPLMKTHMTKNQH